MKNFRSTQMNPRFKLTVIVLIILIAIPTILSLVAIPATNNYCVEQEEMITAKDDNWAIVRNEFIQGVKGKGEIYEKAAEYMIKAIESDNKSRYGENGAKAAMLFIQERNLDLSDDLAKDISEFIESKWSELSANSKDVRELVRAYKVYLGKYAIFPFKRSTIAGWAGYPKIDLEKYGTPVVDKSTKKAQKTRTETGVEIF